MSWRNRYVLVLGIIFGLVRHTSLQYNNTTNLIGKTTNKTCISSYNQTCWKTGKAHSLNDRNTLVFYYVTIVLTVVGYSFVLPPAYRKRQPSSVFIFSLAFADFFIGLAIVPIKITEVLGYSWQNDIVYCRLVNAVTLFGIGLASANVVCISIDRYLYFLIPLNYRTVVTVKKAIGLCFGAFILSLPPLLPAVGIGGKHTVEPLKFCAFKFSLTKTYMWSVGIFYFIVPCIVTIFIQVRILMLTRRYYNQHRKFIHSNPEHQSREVQLRLSMKREMRIQRMFLFVILFFFLCWGPFVMGIICNLVAPHLITPFFIQLMRIMLFINSFINPLVMFLFSDNFQKLVNKIFQRRRRAGDETGDYPTTRTHTQSQPSISMATSFTNYSYCSEGV